MDQMLIFGAAGQNTIFPKKLYMVRSSPKGLIWQTFNKCTVTIGFKKSRTQGYDVSM